MQKRALGQTGITVSVIGFGTVKFGRNQGVKYPVGFDLPTDKEIEKLLAVAEELDINFLDTAPAYGSSEERLGKLLHGKRQQWIIASKVGEEFINGESHFDFSKTAVTHSIERSLKRLNTDYLDSVLIHSNGDDERIIHQEDVFTVLETFKQEGKIRSFGMSTKTIAGGLLAVERCDVVMVTYYPTYTDEHEIILKAKQDNKGVLIKKALASGHLDKLGAVVDPVGSALRFILAEEGVSSVIVGTLNPEHLRENVSVVSV